MSKPSIKIVKKDERSRVRKASAASKSAKKQPDPTRKMIETVSGWVRDFKEKSNVDTSSLIASLFDKTPRPNEA
jgi:hypothetical protein